MMHSTPSVVEFLAVTLKYWFTVIITDHFHMVLFLALKQTHRASDMFSTCWTILVYFSDHNELIHIQCSVCVCCLLGQYAPAGSKGVKQVGSQSTRRSSSGGMVDCGHVSNTEMYMKGSNSCSTVSSRWNRVSLRGSVVELLLRC